MSQDQGSARQSRPLELTAAAGVLLLGGGMIAAARAIRLRNETEGIDPRWWPTAVAVLMLLMGLWMAVDALRGRLVRDLAAGQPGGFRQVVVTVTLLGGVLLAWHAGISFLVLGAVFLLVMNWVHGLRSWSSLVVFPSVVAAVLFVVFQLVLQVRL